MKRPFLLVLCVCAGVSAACDSPAPSGDIVKPDLIATVPAANATDVPVDGSIVLTFSEGMDTASLQVRSSPVASLGAATWTSGNTVATLPLSAPLAFGTSYSLAITAKDLAGNSLPTPTGREFVTVEDTTDPLVTISQPEEGAVFNVTANSAQEIVGTVEDAELATVMVAIDGASEQAVEVVEGTFRIPFTLKLEDSTEHHVSITAKDTSGNTSTASRNFVVDRVAPVVAITAPNADATCTETGCTGPVANLAFGDKIDFTGIASDGGDLDEVKAKFDSTSLVVSSSAEGGGWSASWPGLVTSTDDGVFRTFEISARDAAGNSSTAKRIVFVDRVRPTASQLVDKKRMVDCSEPLPLLRFSEPMDVASVQLATYLGTVLVGSGLESTDSQTFGLAVCPDSWLTYEVLDLKVVETARDRVGNTMSAPSSAKFMSAPAQPGSLDKISVYGRHPDIEVDGDGIPFVAYWDSNAKQFKFAAWNGKNAYVITPIPGTYETVPERPIYMDVIADYVPANSFSRRRTFSIAHTGTTGNIGIADIVIDSPSAVGSISGDALNTLPGNGEIIMGPTITYDGDSQGQWTTVNYPKGWSVQDQWGDYEDHFEAWQIKIFSNPYSKSAAEKINPFEPMGGDAYYDDAFSLLRLQGTDIAVPMYKFLTSAYGLRFKADPQDGRPIGSTYLAWALKDEAAVWLGCVDSNDQPLKVKMQQLTTSGVVNRVFLNTHQGAAESALAISTVSKEVAARPVPTGTCTADPNLPAAWSRTISSATEPAAYARDGKIWVAVVKQDPMHIKVNGLIVVAPAN